MHRSRSPRDAPAAQALVPAMLLPLAAAALQWVLWPWIAPFAWFFFFPAVFLAARLGGLHGGLAATALACALAWYLFIPPQLSWAAEAPSGLYAVALFAATGYMISDVHARLRRARRTSEARFEATFDQAAVGIALVAPDGHWLRVNRRLCEIVGYTQDELLGLTFQDITHPDDLNADLAQMRRMLAREIDSYSMHKRYRRRDGNTVWIKLTVALVWRDDDTPDYFVAVVEDIQARKAAEQSLRESESRLRLFVDHAPVALAMFDERMRYLAASRRWLADYGLEGEQIVGRSHYEIFPEIPERWRRAHRRALDGEVLIADEDRFERADGAVQWLHWQIHPWRRSDDTVGGIVIFTEDIGERMRAREEILRLNAELERRVDERTAELSAANGELASFAYAVSHDLRAPLRAMCGFSRALAEDHGEALDREARDYLGQIELAAGRMNRLIDGLLSLSRSTRCELQRETVDLSGMARQRLAELARDEPGRRVETEVEDGLQVHGDPRLLEAVIRNLLDNAWKYTAHASAPRIRMYREADRICVADNGAGFSMAHAGRLFQPFGRLHREDEFPGIGVGLATVQRIVHRHGGSIEAHGTPGGGAVFRLALPAPVAEDVTEETQ